MPDTPAITTDTDRTGPATALGGPESAGLISVAQLVAHSGNVREALDLTTEFCASIAASGVRIPLLVTRDGDDGNFRVIEGHRRLAAAVKAGLAEVPCVLDGTRAGDEAGQLLDMAIANSDSYRRNFTPAEEAAALFAAHEAGATRTRIRRATGRKAEEIKTALQAGGISADTRAQMGTAAGQLTLDQLALLAEFDTDQETDQEAVAAILEALRRGYAVEYVAERIRQDRAEAAEHERLRAELEAAGTQVTDDLPDGAIRLNGLPDSRFGAGDCTVRAQHGGGGVDRVGGVVRAQRDAGVGVDRVLGEGGRLELHRAFRPGVIRTRLNARGLGLAVVTFDPADAREDRPRQARAGLSRSHIQS
jgi:ParB-like chromosome segregation protein Spo0J